MSYLKPNQERSKSAIILIFIVMGIEIISIISDWFQYKLLQNAALGTISVDEANANDYRQQMIAIIYLVIYIGSAITFILWFRRAYYNLHQLTDYLSLPEGWASGAWFVPIICLYRPYQIMKELFLKSADVLEEKTGSYTSPNTSKLGVWWALWIISNLIGQFVFRSSLRAESIDEIMTFTIASIINGIIGIPLALITIAIIRDYAKTEAILYETNVSGELAIVPLIAEENIDHKTSENLDT
ncbi:DUF4328 domain-containing protein [Pedobacter sp. LMG 31464]|uniref:DUF4328 domain-containing protein n=1 Tax=Pedobacter planticolens TaxID=2679964 RepID=A0A923DWW7_9SPHI|nr:DUF4328 domain-containing protein [Pedobacter planticolens]MBB2145504.1 DUF4328 domain-containing protein [Pedobacter planticolens]